MSAPIRVINNLSGAEYVADTTPRTGNFSAIYCKTATVFTTLTGNYTGGLTPVSHAAGTWLYGKWTVVTLASGTVDLYNL